MESTGFFAVHVDDPGQEYASKVEERIRGGGPDETGVARSGYSVLLGWMQGVPYLIDLGSARRVLVNGASLEPNSPVVLQSGDEITIGSTRLTWNPRPGTSQPDLKPVAVQDPRVTKVLPREDAEPSGPAKSDERAPPDAVDPTLLIPKQVARQVSSEAPDHTLRAPRKGPQPPEPEVPDRTLLALKRTARPHASDAPDPTLLAPKTATGSKAVAPSDTAPEPGESAVYRTAWVDVARVLEEDVALEFEATTILRDTQVPHLVFHLPDRTWEVLPTQERMTIGQAQVNDILIPDETVSQVHAFIERRGDHYLVRDAGSTNGTWIGKERVEQHKLQDGDVVSLGRARMVFKGGFTSDDLTLIGPPRIDGKPARRPVIVVPGLMGTELWVGSERLWPDPKLIITNPEIYRLPGDPRIEARGVLQDVVIVPHIIEQRQYSALGDYLVAGLGYTRGKDLLEFGYDWRHDVRLAAQRLAEAVENWQVKAPITIIAHSLGTLVTRYYVECLGGKRSVERIILMGGPHYGTPGGLAAILYGPGMLPLGMGDERMRAVLTTFPSAYQTLPTYPCVIDQDGNDIDILKDDTWLPEDQRPFLGAVRSFRRELGAISSVPAVSVFGYGLKTKLRVKIDRGPDGIWRKVDFIEDTAGDQSVPSGSAVLKGSEIHPVFQDHGSLYVDKDVMMRLKVELTRSTTWQRRR